MLFVLVFVAIALVALTALSLPLLSGVAALPERGQFDRAVYRDQLREVERDVARGVLSGAEAEAARLEIQRRLLAVERPSTGRAMRFGRSRGLAAVVGVLVVGGATTLYWVLGAPSLPDAPFGARPASAPAAVAAQGAEHVDMRDAAVRLEQKLKADGANPEGWVLYARTLSMLGDWQKAADAYHRAIDLGLKAPDVYTGLGEMLVLSMDGIVAPAAHDAFTTALAADPKNDVARYYLALAAGQAGEVKKAIDSWLGLAAEIPEDSPMREEIKRRIAEAAKASGMAVPALPKGTAAESQPTRAGGPSKDQMDAAAQMPDAERKEMIRGMVTQLATRLQTEPNDVDGWMKLGRAYAVLGESDKAADAYEHAAKLKPGDADIRLQAVGMLIGGLQPSDPLPPRAVAMLREVQAIAPDQPEALWYLGIVAARDGRADEARKYWAKLLAALPAGGEDAKLVKTALGELK